MDFEIKSFCKENHLNSQNVSRVITKNRNVYGLVNVLNERMTVTITNGQKFYVGDFVEYMIFEGEVYIRQSLPRKNIISKAYNTTQKAYNTTQIEEQVLATNVDQLFILIAADQRFTLSKFERYVLVFSGMSEDVHVLITKSDFTKETDLILKQIRSVYPQLRVIAYSIYNEESLKNVYQLIKEEKTAILVGASGAGKSSLVNNLLGRDDISTRKVRRDGKGKHTTTSSQLYYVKKTNSYLIDSPGFKGIETSREINTAVLFEEIENLSLRCKFNDCKHQSEPGCAIKNAIKDGDLEETLFERYLLQTKKRKAYEQYLEEKNRKKKH
ncbi:ribosome small subunit-dependent GTPase A [Facklamia sp. DSM 111018]|uniref:Ribosome small subunit-dependent GTPase A n=1 Tax=Facklamia lactis TaxID=2749967 RepID=A0ABS0LQF6_9LACT|nr:ribosome small subunit-dependent GTPase A [Facklamia lactis]MBG9980389.1 ribosome small subunit-dependent GTPase A [Facklamia lactis]MBG9986192.1 ribosome small subunit-dependent GTPase A [Facklamia lactis]